MPIITLTTDFGTGSPYVAELKGAILSIAPQVTLVDVTHAIAPQNVVQGARALAQVWRTFPKGSIHVAVVDPGVGTQRDILLLRVEQQYFVGPDNGLLSLVTSTPDEVRCLKETRYWRTPTSHTFHGRDIMGPCAAHLAQGVPSSSLGSTHPAKPIAVEANDAVVTDEQVTGEIQMWDSFGNLITNIHRDALAHLGDSYEVVYQDRHLPVATTYGEHPPGSSIALLGSSQWLEIAIVQGNAHAELRGEVGQTVEVKRKKA